MKISIALCTYNGEKYLKQQINSFISQTRIPDELIVCDDGSKDGTVDILEEFQKNAPFCVTLEINEKNLGTRKNYEKAISLCKGDIIALSDQDDIWSPTKLKRIEELFLINPGIGAIFSNAEVVNANLFSTGNLLWDLVGLTKKRQHMIQTGKAIKAFIQFLYVTGSTLAFKSIYWELIKPIPDYWMHDAWIVLQLAILSEMKIISEPLIQYRQHNNNQIGVRKKSIIEKYHETLAIDHKKYYSEELFRYKAALYRMKDYAKNSKLTIKNYDYKVELLKCKINHVQKRANLPKNRILRLPFLFMSLIKLEYIYYTWGWEVAVRDLLITR